jgi:hypothetical protein
MNKYFPEAFLKEANPNAVGEFLRDIFFYQSKGEYGCYTTFDVRAFVNPLPDEEIEGIEDYIEAPDNLHWTVYEYNGIKMRYYWDGDGTLEFILSDDRILSNTDCKKSHNWEWIKD